MFLFCLFCKGRGAKGKGPMNITPAPNDPDAIHYLNFNQDFTCVSVGTQKGFRIYNCEPFGKCYENHEGGAGICEMMFSSSLVAVAGIGEPPTFSPRKLRILNTKRQTIVCELSFPTKILAVKLNRRRMVVVGEEKICIYDMGTMMLVHTIETVGNGAAVCALSADAEKCYLAYPTNLENGELAIFDTISLQHVCAIQAHKTPISSASFNHDATLLATASDKGTIIRVFSIPDAVNLHQFRRGTYPATVYGLNFNLQSDLLAVSSDSDTIHIFKLKPRKHSKLLGSVLGSQLSQSLESARHFAKIKLPSSRLSNLCAISSSSPTVMVITGDGYFYEHALDMEKGGECRLLRRYSLMSHEE